MWGELPAWEPFVLAALRPRVLPLWRENWGSPHSSPPLVPQTPGTWLLPEGGQLLRGDSLRTPRPCAQGEQAAAAAARR